MEATGGRIGSPLEIAISKGRNAFVDKLLDFDTPPLVSRSMMEAAAANSKISHPTLMRLAMRFPDSQEMNNMLDLVNASLSSGKAPEMTQRLLETLKGSTQATDPSLLENLAMWGDCEALDALYTPSSDISV